MAGRVLIVDDDDAVRQSLELLFRSEGYAPIVFDSAAALLSALPIDRPACLIADIMMSGMNGLELQALLREREVDIPILFLTGHATVPLCISAMKNGATDFLEKPVRAEVIVPRVEQAIAADAEGVRRDGRSHCHDARVRSHRGEEDRSGECAQRENKADPCRKVQRAVDHAVGCPAPVRDRWRPPGRGRRGRGDGQLRAFTRVDTSTLGRMARRALGGAAQHLVETGSWIAIVRILAGLGSTAVAGYTVATRIVMFTLLPVWGFSNATATLVGQSLGAGKPARAERSVWASGLLAMVFMGGVALVFLAFPAQLVSFFTDDAKVVAVAGGALHVLAFGYLFYAWQMVCQQAFDGAGDTTTPVLINLGCFWVLLLPLAWGLAFPAGWGTSGVFIAVAVSYSVAGLVSVALVRRGRWKEATA